MLTQRNDETDEKTQSKNPNELFVEVFIVNIDALFNVRWLLQFRCGIVTWLITCEWADIHVCELNGRLRLEADESDELLDDVSFECVRANEFRIAKLRHSINL